MSERIVLYLDQNKWIELAQAVDEPAKKQVTFNLFENLLARVQSGNLVVALSASNIYETQKVNDPIRRRKLAVVQSTLSQGMVFKGPAFLGKQELFDFLVNVQGLPAQVRKKHWFLSNGFFEAFSEANSNGVEIKLPDWYQPAVQADPVGALSSFFMDLPEETRIESIRRWSSESNVMIENIRERRQSWRSESHAMQRRAYKALILIGIQDLVNEVLSEINGPLRDVVELGLPLLKAVIEKVPILHVESALASTIESEVHDINENDLRDMSAFYTVLPYAATVVAEKAFVGRALQAKLHTHYDVRLLTDLRDLASIS